MKTRIILGLLVTLLPYSSCWPSEIATIAASSEWKKLLHFDRDSLWSGSRSAILDDTFFLSPQGSEDPAAELEATLIAFEEPEVSGNLHALCRFPARALWLEKVTGKTWNRGIDCPEYDVWKRQYQHSDIGVVFATGYLGNPASFFGHLMLHITQGNKKPDDRKRHLLDTSINFGADVPKDENMLVYMANGLLGGYEAQFSNAPFYRNTTIYSESEMRDLWYYRLSIPDWERKLLLAHLWEIRGKNYEYLFLSQNCASRIAHTLELVTSDSLVNARAVWATPEDVIRRIASAKTSEGNLLASIENIPSRRLITERLYEDLDAKSKLAAKTTWPSLDSFNLENDAYRSLTLDEKSGVIETLMSHAEFLSKTTDSEFIPSIKQQLLIERLDLPVRRSEAKKEDVAELPVHQARKSKMLSAQAVYNDHLGTGSRLTFRPLQYNVMDSDRARMNNASLEIGKVTVNTLSQRLQLQEATLFNVENLDSDRLPLPGLPTLAWMARSGWQRTDLDCSSCGQLYASALAGRSFGWGKHHVFGLVGATLRSTSSVKGPVAAAGDFGVLTQWTPTQRSQVRARYRDALQGLESRGVNWTFDYRLRLSSEWDLQTRYETQLSVHEASVGLNWYF